MNNIPELSIIILCYRSEESIVDFVDQTRKLVERLTGSFEIILVANYFENSSDRTVEFVNRIAENDNRFKIVSIPKKGMMGWDMRTGLNRSSGKYLCVIDGDGQFPIDSIARCYKEIKSGKFGLVKTYRRKRRDGLYRRLLSFSYNLIFALLFPGLGSRDVNSKPKIMTRKTYEMMKLHSDDWFIDAEIMINIRRFKINFFEFPIEFRQLKGRHSFVKLGAIFEFVRNLIIYRIEETRRYRLK